MPFSHTNSGDELRPALHLIPTERSRATHAAPRMPSASPEDSASLAALRAQLAEVRAQLANAMEEVVFQREQLRSAQAFHEHLLEVERARHRLARHMIARDLAVLMAGLTRDAESD
jgi:hypothetical protein